MSSLSIATKSDLEQLRLTTGTDITTAKAYLRAEIANAKVQLIVAMIAVGGLFTSILFFLLRH